MIDLNKLKWKVKALLTPTCWLQNQAYNKQYDEWLYSAISRGSKFTFVSSYVVFLEGKQLWIQNYPYACMCPYDNPFNLGASRATVLYAYEELRSQYATK